MGVIVDKTNKKDTSKIVNGVTYGIDTIFISGAGYIDYPFVGVSRDSALGWQEATWSGELTRTQAFALSNIADVKFGLVSRVELSFNYENRLDYIVLQKIAHERVCYVTYYNRELCEWVEKEEMAFTGNELDKLYAFGKDDFGRMGVKIKLVGTNRQKQYANYTITLNAGTGGSGTTQTIQKSWCEAIKLENYLANFTRQGYNIVKWCTNINGVGGLSWLPNALLTVTNNLTLYAIWGN